MEPFGDLGAIWIIESHYFGNLIASFRLEVRFKIFLRLFTTALSLSPSFIQSGFGPKL